MRRKSWLCVIQGLFYLEDDRSGLLVRWYRLTCSTISDFVLYRICTGADSYSWKQDQAWKPVGRREDSIVDGNSLLLLLLYNLVKSRASYPRTSMGTGEWLGVMNRRPAWPGSRFIVGFCVRRKKGALLYSVEQGTLPCRPSAYYARQQRHYKKASLNKGVPGICYSCTNRVAFGEQVEHTDSCGSFRGQSGQSVFSKIPEP